MARSAMPSSAAFLLLIHSRAAYRRELKKHAREHYPETIDFFDLDDVYPHMRNFDVAGGIAD
jgi:hypothetical protein